MSIFHRLFHTHTVSDTAQADATPVSTKPVSKFEHTDTRTSVTPSPAFPTPLVLLPHISEKAAMLATKRTYVFQVALHATKSDIRRAVEQAYATRVVRVNIIRGEGKRVRRGNIYGQRTRSKKALVTLREGEKIQMHEGV